MEQLFDMNATVFLLFWKILRACFTVNFSITATVTASYSVFFMKPPKVFLIFIHPWIHSLLSAYIKQLLLGKIHRLNKIFQYGSNDLLHWRVCLLSITNPELLQPEEGSKDKALFYLAFPCFQCMPYSESALLNSTNLQVIHFWSFSVFV